MAREFRNRLSRRRLLASAAGAASGLVVASRLGRRAVTLAQTAVEDGATASPSPSVPVMTPDAVLRDGIERGLTGVALRIERGDAVVFDGAAGLAIIEQQTPMVATDRFGIGSITKTFTSTLVLQLVDAGVLTLDDTVTQWLSDPVVGRIPYVDRITLRQLLSHTSGIYDYFDGDSAFWQDAYFGDGADWTRKWTPEEVLVYADGAKHAPYFAPGEGAQYSNTGYVLLGLIVEQAGGQRYAQQLQTRIIDPLGLTNTVYAATEPVPGGVVDAYHLIDGALVNVSTIDLSALGAAGGMVSTTRDLVRFASALFGGKLLSAATLAEMTDFIPVGRTDREGGLGVFRKLAPDGEAMVGNDGDSPGMAARMYRLHDADLTIVMLANTGGEDEIVDAVYAEAVQAALALSAATVEGS